jgi:hypothetical protein
MCQLAKRALQAKVVELGQKFDQEKLENAKTIHSHSIIPALNHSAPNLTIKNVVLPITPPKSHRTGKVLMLERSLTVVGSLSVLKRTMRSEKLPTDLLELPTDFAQGICKFKLTLVGDWVNKHCIL